MDCIIKFFFIIFPSLSLEIYDLDCVPTHVIIAVDICVGSIDKNLKKKVFISTFILVKVKALYFSLCGHW